MRAVAYQVVSSDFLTDTHSSVVDAKAGIQLNPTFVKVHPVTRKRFEDAFNGWLGCSNKEHSKH
jgi:hypothetical protein